MISKLVSVLAAASMLAVSVPANASVATRSSDAIPTAKAHSRYADGKKAEKAGRKAGRAGRGAEAEGTGGGGLGVSTTLVAGLLAAVGIAAVAVTVSTGNRSN